ncbi:hypothetical protein N658DRAFT_286472 [Parathielavia hyrcaniae]|uniref:Uncharacterized protein n=1 Tax=Parathielavia hyrcaniae TaxID=113614 RepID=A0AAN6Q554_9PEZI|nr:hypothetical protein N658DRAFT_286472 [Parathielavia hyrcaniae]
MKGSATAGFFPISGSSLSCCPERCTQAVLHPRASMLTIFQALHARHRLTRLFGSCTRRTYSRPVGLEARQIVCFGLSCSRSIGARTRTRDVLSCALAKQWFTDTLVTGNAALACWAVVELPPRPSGLVELPLSSKRPPHGAAVPLPWSCTLPARWVVRARPSVPRQEGCRHGVLVMQPNCTKCHHLPPYRRCRSLIGSATPDLDIHRSTPMAPLAPLGPKELSELLLAGDVQVFSAFGRLGRRTYLARLLVGLPLLSCLALMTGPSDRPSRSFRLEGSPTKLQLVGIV